MDGEETGQKNLPSKYATDETSAASGQESRLTGPQCCQTRLIHVNQNCQKTRIGKTVGYSKNG